MNVSIPHNKPTLGIEEIKAIEKVVRSCWIAQGKTVERFENGFCAYIRLQPHRAVALSSGTSALYLALKTLEIAPHSEVILPTYVCSAVLNAVHMAGLKPVLTDIDGIDFNTSRRNIADRITRKTKAIIVPHIFGVPADIPSLKVFGKPIIEDCAVALGSKIKDRHVGTFGDIAMYSFYASKVITTGQGGMLVSKNLEYADKTRDYREFDQRGVYYPRFNFQMTDIQAGMGLEQLKKLNTFLRKRAQIAARYITICNNKGWDYQRSKDSSFSQNWYRFVLKLDNKNAVGRLKRYLHNHGLKTIIPVARWELLHNYLHISTRGFKTAEEISQRTLSLPIYPCLVKEDNLEKIVKLLKGF